MAHTANPEPKSSNRVWLPRLEIQNSSSHRFAASCFSFGTSELREPRNLTQAVQTGDTLDAVRMADCSNQMATLKLRSSNPVATFAFVTVIRVLLGEVVEPFDGIAELWVESEEALLRDWSTDKAKKYVRVFFEDEKNFIDWTRSTILLSKENVVFA